MLKPIVVLDDFMRGYLYVALWSSTDNSREDGGDPLTDNYDVDDIHPESVAEQRETCADFVNANMADLLDYVAKVGDHQDMNAWQRAGGDFWYTRVGHGVGYWDRGLGELGDRLTKAAKVYGGADAYVGDDGRIYIT